MSSVRTKLFLSIGSIRVLSNYARLAVTFTSGLITVRVMGEIGTAALSTYLLTLALTGFAQFGKIVLRESAIPLLGLHWSEDSKRLSFAARTVIHGSVFAATFAAIAFVLFWITADLFDTGILRPSSVAIAFTCAGLQLIVSSLAMPALSALLVSKRLIAYNLALAMERLAEVIAVFAVYLLLSEESQSVQFSVFYVIATFLYIGVQGFVWLAASSGGSRALFALQSTTASWRDEVAFIRPFASYNLMIVIGFLLHQRLSTLLGNVLYGEEGILLFGIAFILVSYMHQITLGLAIGLDAFASRLRSGEDGQELLISSTIAQAAVAAMTLTSIWILGEPMVRLWVGGTLEDSGVGSRDIAFVASILTIGTFARTVSESWMKILNGRGAVGDYAPSIFAGALIHASILVLVAIAALEMGVAIPLIAASYSAIHVVVHLWVVPGRVGTRMGVPRTALLRIVAFWIVLFAGLAMACTAAASWLYILLAPTLTVLFLSLGGRRLVRLVAGLGSRHAASTDGAR